MESSGTGHAGGMVCVKMATETHCGYVKDHYLAGSISTQFGFVMAAEL